MKYKIIVIISGCFVFSANCFGAFQYLDVGARPLGMAGAYVTVGDDASAAVWNPAGVSKIKKAEISTMYCAFYPDLIDPLGLSFVSFVYPNQKIGNIGVGVVEMGNSIYNESVVALTYARTLSFLNNISLGVNVKNMSKKYGSTGYTDLDPTFSNSMGAGGYGFDFGLNYPLNSKFTLSFVGKNINEPDIHLADTDIVPAVYTAGFGCKYNEIIKELW